MARLRLAYAHLRAGVALVLAEELELSLLPQVGYQWLPTGEPGEVMTPGTPEKRYRAGALHLTTGTLPPGVG